MSQGTLKSRDLEDLKNLLISGHDYIIEIGGKEIEVMTDWIEIEVEHDGEVVQWCEWAIIPAQRGLPIALWIVDTTPSLGAPLARCATGLKPLRPTFRRVHHRKPAPSVFSRRLTWPRCSISKHKEMR